MDCSQFAVMFEFVDPVCPMCGSIVSDFVSEFLFSGDEIPTLRNTLARIRGHKCGCGHHFVVVSYGSDERKQTTLSKNGDPSGAAKDD